MKKPPKPHLTDAEIAQELDKWFTDKNPDTSIDPAALDRMTKAAIAYVDAAPENKGAAGDEFIGALIAADPILSRLTHEQIEALKAFPSPKVPQ